MGIGVTRPVTGVTRLIDGKDKNFSQISQFHGIVLYADRLDNFDFPIE